MSAKPTWSSFLDLPKAGSDFLEERPSFFDDGLDHGRNERLSMKGQIESDGKDLYVKIPEELLDRSGIDAEGEVDISGERLDSGYVITIRRVSDKPSKEEEL